MDNDDIVVEHSPAEQPPHNGNQQCENLTQNQSNSAKPDNVIPKAKKGPMDVTPLYISFFPSQSS